MYVKYTNASIEPEIHNGRNQLCRILINLTKFKCDNISQCLPAKATMYVSVNDTSDWMIYSFIGSGLTWHKERKKNDEAKLVAQTTHYGVGRRNFG